MNVQNMDHGETLMLKENAYLRNMEEGYRAVLAGLYKLAQLGEAA